MRDLADRFTAADLADLPAVTSYESDLHKVLWVLWAGKTRLATTWLTPGEIETVLRDAYGIRIPRQRIPGLLPNSLAARKKVGGRYAFQIMHDGVGQLEAIPAAVTFVDPAQALSRIREVESLLGERTGVVSVCDPYADGRTLDLLAECSSAAELRLLTMDISKPNPFHRDLGAFRQQHPKLPIEVRVGPQGALHDRYLIDDGGMLIFGTSLNSLGRKQSFVINVGEDTRRVVLAEFDRLWRQSATWT